MRMSSPDSSVHSASCTYPRALWSNQPRTFIADTHPKLVYLPKKLGLVYRTPEALVLVVWHMSIVNTVIGWYDFSTQGRAVQ